MVAKATDCNVTLPRYYFHSQFMLSHWSSFFLVSLSPLIVMTNQAIETHTDNKSPRAKNILSNHLIMVSTYTIASMCVLLSTYLTTLKYYNIPIYKWFWVCGSVCGWKCMWFFVIHFNAGVVMMLGCLMGVWINCKSTTLNGTGSLLTEWLISSCGKLKTWLWLFFTTTYFCNARINIR